MSPLNSSKPSMDLEMCPTAQYFVDDIGFQIFFYCLYAIVFCVGTLGNCLVVYIILRNQSMQNPTNLFIANLACSDILMCLFSVPFTPVQSFTGKWLFGEILCVLFPVSQGTSVYISTLTMTLIAVDRFVVVCYPYRQRMQAKTSLLFIALIDLLAIAFVLPYAFHIKIIVGYDGADRCNETWFGVNRLIYGIFTSITQFVLPFVTIIACYTTVIIKLRRRPQERPGLPSQVASRQDQELRRTQRTNRMLMSMVAVFGICWLPINSINLVADLNFYPIYCWQFYHAFFILCHIMAVSSLCFNPFLYGLFNDTFKHHFLDICPSLRFICGQRCNDMNNHLEMNHVLNFHSQAADMDGNNANPSVIV